jgi:hypothetical protein
MTLVIMWGAWLQSWVLNRHLFEAPLLMLTVRDILDTFGAFMAFLLPEKNHELIGYGGKQIEKNRNHRQVTKRILHGQNVRKTTRALAAQSRNI